MEDMDKEMLTSISEFCVLINLLLAFNTYYVLFDVPQVLEPLNDAVKFN
jgi:hypothetical protein